MAIVGGGVVGIACALELARRGTSVRVLERGRLGHGCSYGNAGWLTASLALPLAAPGQTFKALAWLLDRESPFYIRPRLDPALAAWLVRFLMSSRRAPFERGAEALIELSRRSVDFWERLASETTEPFGFERNGLLAVYESKQALAFARRRAALTARFGIPHEEWTAEQVRDREPAIRGLSVGGLFFPEDAHCEPYGAVRALISEARRLGVRFDEQAEVLDVSSNGAGDHLRTARGVVHAKEIVVAAGAWSGSFGRRLNLRLPMLGAKGYSLLARRVEPHPVRSIYLTERKIAVTPHAETLRIAGTLELVGEDLSMDARRVGAIVRDARAMLEVGELSTADADVWRGLRPCMPDGMPAIGRTRGARNVWLATGHQMTGLKTAPATGRLLAELICGEAPSVDPAPFRADRF
ncbi:MAG: FAD-dependent oxidoreductase [Acidobacteria bacterium]|nr:FAD-dependent oxidoreductase [Acidobacteriota bacterium]NIQ30630.1 FAD-dependent oxidoreductase [Acidobacteriota bacterium]NIQ85588.1 FAD-dependent oxidoreductase [Acidobacteriota bacterium]